MSINEGDKVRIKSKDWFESYKMEPYADIIIEEDTIFFTEKMLGFCGKTATVTKTIGDGDDKIFEIDIDNGSYYWHSNWVDVIKEKSQYITKMETRRGSDYTVLLFGKLYIIADVVNGYCIPEFFNSLEDAENYIINYIINKEGN